MQAHILTFSVLHFKTHFLCSNHQRSITVPHDKILWNCLYCTCMSLQCLWTAGHTMTVPKHQTPPLTLSQSVFKHELRFKSPSTASCICALTPLRHDKGICSLLDKESRYCNGYYHFLLFSYRPRPGATCINDAYAQKTGISRPSRHWY